VHESIISGFSEDGKFLQKLKIGKETERSDIWDAIINNPTQSPITNWEENWCSKFKKENTTPMLQGP